MHIQNVVYGLKVCVYTRFPCPWIHSYFVHTGVVRVRVSNCLFKSNYVLHALEEDRTIVKGLLDGQKTNKQ
jgi:hypothetical protein